MRILICGAGVAGLSLAGCLGRQGHEVLVVERSPRLREGGYMIDFFGPGFDVAERLGLLPRLAAIHDPVDRLIFADAAGHERVTVRYDVLRRRLFRDRHFNFLRADLEGVLFEALPSRRVVQFGLTVVAVEQDSHGVRVTLSDGRVVETDLLVGADGVHSWIRGLAFDEESRFVRNLGYVAAAFVINEPPDAFGIGKDVVTLTAPGHQVAVYPIRSTRVAAFFLRKTTGPFRGSSSTSARCELETHYRDFGALVPKLLRASTSASHVYLDAVTQVVMKPWTARRVVLLGDAAQCVSLLAGQGASMAVAGAWVLAEALDCHEGDVAAALAWYEARLRPVINRQQRAGRRMAKWFIPEGRLGLIVRDWATRAAAWPLVAPLLRRQLAAADRLAG
jgi:2-polyprenyl-6-methoxyphenol hydroxylase-like FAD-dependent oxidoreductase